MRGRVLSGVALVTLMAVAGCSGGDNSYEYDKGTTYDLNTLWGGESASDRARRIETEQRLLAKVPITAVRSVELGRTRDGFLITAQGTAPGLGYSLPILRARRGGRPGADGYVEFDFVASEPAAGSNLPRGTSQARAMTAVQAVRVNDLRGAAGIRVLALTGGIQVDF